MQRWCLELPVHARSGAATVAVLSLFASCSSPSQSVGTHSGAADGGAASVMDAGDGSSSGANQDAGSSSGPTFDSGADGSVCMATPAAGANTVVIDGAGAGRTFDFIGGLSGGGGTSRLLYDYPPQQQAEILDYLFKPGYGASLQLLKVEIGADTDTTNGAEATHERTPTDRNYHRGYEWWLMQQAKLRNPNIKLYGLEWGAPGWFNGGFYSTDNTQYIIDWITNAQSVYGLTIDYIGGWNEMGYYGPWLVSLKAALARAGLGTRLVAADGYQDLSIATDSTPGVLPAVDVLGVHYPCGYQSDGSQCNTLANLQAAIALGKPLWASEEGSEPYNTGGAPMARVYNRHYIQAKMTGSINWSVVGSWYANLPFGGVDGLLFASQPWSGYYAVDKEIWVTAHTTQFVQPGWQYVDSGSALASGTGSYVTLKSPNNKDWSVILETAVATSAQTFTFVQTGGAYAGPVHVWATDLGAIVSTLGATAADRWFVQQADISPSNCTFSFVAQPNYVYTLTTTVGQGKGKTSPPVSSPLAIPYGDDFESYTVSAMPNIPRFFSAVEGAFEVENCVGGRTGKCLQQEVAVAPIGWGSAASPNPVTIVGDPGWTDYAVSVDALLQQAGSVDLIGRITAQDQKGGGVEGYHLQVAGGGAWTLFRQDLAMVNTTLASGTGSFALNTWHTLALDFIGSTVTARYDGATLATVTDATYAKGSAGLSVSQWNNAQFDNFAVVGP
jgi:hypothetical protein